MNALVRMGPPRRGGGLFCAHPGRFQGPMALMMLAGITGGPALGGPSAAGNDPAGIRISAVALSGQQAPGAAAGTVFFGGFDPAVTNSRGQVVFYATLAGPDVDGLSNSGVYMFNAGALSKVIRANEQAIGFVQGITYREGQPTLTPILADDGTLALVQFVRGGGFDASRHFGLWVGPPGQLRLVAARNQPAPGTSFVFEFVNSLALSRAGAVFSIVSVPPNRPSGVFRGDLWRDFAGGLANLAPQGAPAPGLPGVTIGRPGIHIWDDNGRLWWDADIVGPNVQPGIDDYAAWSGLLGTPELYARANSSFGLPAGLTIRGVARGIGTSGTTAHAFNGLIYGDDATQFNDSAVIIGALRDNSHRVLWREGDAVPGAPGFIFSGVQGAITPFEHIIMSPGRFGATFVMVDGGTPRLTPRSRWAFLGQVDRTDPWTIIAGGPVQPAGLPTGVRIYSVDRLSLNSRGDVVYQTRLEGPGIGTDVNAIVAKPIGQPGVVLARQGAPFVVAPGDSRIVDRVSLTFCFSGGGEGRHIVLNNRREVVFSLVFRDGSSGLFIAAVGCPADHNSNGTVDFFDYLDFIIDFNDGAFTADFDGNGIVDFFDYLDFIAALSGDCN
jgi:hypothetical protein